MRLNLTLAKLRISLAVWPLFYQLYAGYLFTQPAFAGRPGDRNQNARMLVFLHDGT